MVDFANKNIGGGVLRRGLVQEELLFMTYPELILAKLMMPREIAPNEAVVITNVVRTSDYEYRNRQVVPVRIQNAPPILGHFAAVDP